MTDDLCDRLTEALYERALKAAQAKGIKPNSFLRLASKNEAGHEADAVLAVVQAEIRRLADDLKWSRAELAKADAENNAAGKRAERAEAAIERVRRLCELTIASSCRVQAIEQAKDTLRVLDQPKEQT